MPSYEFLVIWLVAVIGIIIRVFFNSPIWGYGTIAIAVMSLLFVGFAITDQGISSYRMRNTGQFMWRLLTSSAPTLFLIVILAWLLGINMAYRERIESGHVANEYELYSGISTFLVGLQLIALFMLNSANLVKNMRSGSGTGGAINMEKVSEYAERASPAFYLIGTLNLVVVGIMNIILHYFSTDG